MLLAGGQGTRLGVLTKDTAKPAVPFGGKYRIIDFPLSNCINSGIDTIGVLTQYQPFDLNQYIGNGQPWDLDRLNGGVHNTKPRCLFLWHIDNCNRTIRIAFFVCGKHFRIIHFINMVAGQNQNIFWHKFIDKCNILINRIGSTFIPLA